MRVIDFHSHILPAIDDGSESVEMSLEMLRRMKAYGADLVVSTSHFYGRRSTADEFLERRHRAAEKIVRALSETEFGSLTPAILSESMRCLPDLPEVRLGAEVAFRFGIEEDPNLERLCIEGTNTLLLELPFGDWTEYEADAVASIAVDRGLDVVLAHFERFPSFRKNSPIAERLMGLPVTLQVNAEDLLPFMTRGKVLDLFRRRNTPILGSDAHNLTDRAPNLDAGREMIRKKLGERTLADCDRKAAELIGLEE